MLGSVLTYLLFAALDNPFASSACWQTQSLAQAALILSRWSTREKWDEQFYHGFCWNRCFFCILLVTSFFLNCTKMEWVLWKTVSFWNVCCHFSYVWLFATLWNIVPQASLSMGFSRQERCSGLPCPPPGDLPNPGTEPESLTSPALADRFLTWEAQYLSWRKEFIIKL